MAVSPFLTVTMRDGAEKYGEAIREDRFIYGLKSDILDRESLLTVYFKLNDLADTGSNAIMSLTHIESFAVLLDVL